MCTYYMLRVLECVDLFMNACNHLWTDTSWLGDGDVH